MPLREESESGAANKATVASLFKERLNSLRDTLYAADTNFVRCIKTSNPLCRGVFTKSLVLDQLKYTGMLDTLKIRRAGYALRMDPQTFYDDYHVLDVNAPDYTALVASVQALVPEVVE